MSTVEEIYGDKQEAPTVKQRGVFLPRAIMSDESTDWAVPGILHAPYSAAAKILGGAPLSDVTGEDVMSLGGVMTPGLGRAASGRVRGALEPGVELGAAGGAQRQRLSPQQQRELQELIRQNPEMAEQLRASFQPAALSPPTQAPASIVQPLAPVPRAPGPPEPVAAKPRTPWNRRLNDDEWQKLVQRHQEGASIHQLEREFGMARQNISRKLIEQGIREPGRKDQVLTKIPVEVPPRAHRNMISPLAAPQMENVILTEARLGESAKSIATQVNRLLSGGKSSEGPIKAADIRAKLSELRTRARRHGVELKATGPGGLFPAEREDDREAPGVTVIERQAAPGMVAGPERPDANSQFTSLPGIVVTDPRKPPRPRVPHVIKKPFNREGPILSRQVGGQAIDPERRGGAGSFARAPWREQPVDPADAKLVGATRGLADDVREARRGIDAEARLSFGRNLQTPTPPRPTPAQRPQPIAREWAPQSEWDALLDSLEAQGAPHAD